MNKTISSIILLTVSALFTLTACGQQKMKSDEWDKQAKTDIRLLPKYGNKPKTKEQKKADQEYIDTQIELFKDRTAASNDVISSGFNYLLYRGDAKTAMYRFNQAYLLDSLNSDIYWGYAAVYMTLGKYEKARQQYDEGLSINPNNTHLLTDYGNYFMVQFNELEPTYKNGELRELYLDSAITYLFKSYQFDNSNLNTIFKLFVCYFDKNETDCENIMKYYNESKDLGGERVVGEYTKYLKDRCK